MKLDGHIITIRYEGRQHHQKCCDYLNESHTLWIYLGPSQVLCPDNSYVTQARFWIPDETAAMLFALKWSNA